MITPQDIHDLLEGSDCFFGVTFIKKDGSERRMTAKFGVKKTLKGGPPAYDPNLHGLLWVTDINAYRTKPHGPKDLGRRSINVATLSQIRARGRVWNISHGILSEG